MSEVGYLGKDGGFFYQTSGGWIEITEVVSLTAPPEDVAKHDVTALGDNTKRYRPGMVESGEFDAEIIYTPTVYALIRGFKTSITHFKIEFPDGTAATFDAFCTKSPVEEKPDEVTMIKAAFQIDGTVLVA